MSIRVGVLVCLLAWGCAHAPSMSREGGAEATGPTASAADGEAGSEGEATGEAEFQVFVTPMDGELRKAVWAKYAVMQVQAQSYLENEAPGLGPHVAFHSTYLAMIAAADEWGEKKAASGEEDPLLDVMTRAVEDQLIQEYAAAYHARAGWWIEPGQLQAFDFDAFLEWEKEHVPASHDPTPMATVLKGEESIWAPAPASWLRDIDPAILQSCGEGRKERARLVERWFEEGAELGPLPIQPGRQAEVIPLLLSARSKPRAQEHGVIFVDGRLGSLLFLEGFCHADRGDYAAAERPLRELLELTPTNPRSYSELVFVLSATGQHEEAIRLGTEGLSKTDDPCFLAKLLRQRGYSYIELGQLTLARHSYLLSLELQPDHELALRQLTYIRGLQAVAGTEEVEPREEGVETPHLRIQSTCPAPK